MSDTINTNETTQPVAPSNEKHWYSWMGSKWFLIPVSFVAGAAVGTGVTLILGRTAGEKCAEAVASSIAG